MTPEELKAQEDAAAAAAAEKENQGPQEGQEPSQDEEPKSKADWLQELQDAGIVDDALEYDNLKVVQIQQLLEKFNTQNTNDNEIVKRRLSEQKYNELKKKVQTGISQLQDFLK